MSIYYVTPVIGTGTRSDPFRTAMNNYSISNVTVIPTDPVTGHPVFAWALVAIPDGTNTTQVDADSTIDKFPVSSLDTQINQLTQQQKSAFQALGVKYGVTKIQGLKNTDTIRTALTDFGQQLDPAFDPNTFSVV